MSDPDLHAEASGAHLWEQGWDGHESAQRRRMAALSLVEKLRWLEEAQETLLAMEASRRAGQQTDVPKDP